MFLFGSFKERGISPVIGALLLTAITVLTVSMLAVFIHNFTNEQLSTIENETSRIINLVRYQAPP